MRRVSTDQAGSVRGGRAFARLGTTDLGHHEWLLQPRGLARYLDEARWFADRFDETEHHTDLGLVEEVVDVVRPGEIDLVASAHHRADFQAAVLRMV